MPVRKESNAFGLIRRWKDGGTLLTITGKLTYTMDDVVQTIQENQFIADLYYNNDSMNEYSGGENASKYVNTDGTFELSYDFTNWEEDSSATLRVMIREVENLSAEYTQTTTLNFTYDDEYNCISATAEQTYFEFTIARTSGGES